MKLDVDIFLKQGKFLLNTQFKCFESALGIFGPSGCGKSTLFRAIAGLVKPDGGHIILDGKTLFNADSRVFVPPHKRNIGLVFQDARLFPHWSVEENLRAGECIKARAANRPYSFDDIVDLLNVSHLTGRRVADLSGGEKQRIAIGRTLLSHPKLLLMDEPVTGLDVSLKMQILPFLAKVHQTLKIPTVLISHDLGEILQLTDQLLLMREGAVTGYGTLERLSRNPETMKELSGADLTNMITANIREHRPERGTTLLELPASGHLLVMELSQKFRIGQMITLGIAANQIALALEPNDKISMRNQLPGIVGDIVNNAERCLCSVATHAGSLFVEITPGTVEDLNLYKGKNIWVMFKSRALEQLSLS